MLKNNPNLKRAVINDVKHELVGIYTAIKKDVDTFVRRVDSLQSAYIMRSKADRKKLYYELRDEYTNDWKKWSSTVDSATLYFLMKTAFNGIWQINQSNNPDARFSTPSGLLNHKDTVYNKDTVLCWHEVLKSKVEIHCGDWSELCNYSNAFYFLDPPYRDSFTSYGNEFGDTEHKKLLEFAQQTDRQGNLVFYCNRDDNDDGFFDQHCGHLSKTHYDIKYTAGRRQKVEGKYEAKAAREILIYSPSIKPADTEPEPILEPSAYDKMFVLEKP
jgi:DNA adenine methylase